MPRETILKIKDVPDDLYERIKNYVEGKGEEWDDNKHSSTKHFFYFNKNLLVFDEWSYGCPIPDYRDLDVKEDDNTVKIVSKIVNKK